MIPMFYEQVQIKEAIPNKLTDVTSYGLRVASDEMNSI